jgi:Protein of unknown function (DUF2568)
VVAANLTLRLLLELCLLAAVAFWGAGAGSGTGLHIALAVAAPVVVAAVWGAAVSPRAPVRLSRPAWVIVQLVLFGLGAAALAAAGRPVLGGVFAAAAAANLALVAPHHFAEQASSGLDPR